MTRLILIMVYVFMNIMFVIPIMLINCIMFLKDYDYEIEVLIKCCWLILLKITLHL